jgi:hypothetical protein
LFFVTRFAFVKFLLEEFQMAISWRDLEQEMLAIFESHGCRVERAAGEAWLIALPLNEFDCNDDDSFEPISLTDVAKELEQGPDRRGQGTRAGDQMTTGKDPLTDLPTEFGAMLTTRVNPYHDALMPSQIKFLRSRNIAAGGRSIPASQRKTQT